jgi:lipid-A-disaccharide synthase
MMRHSEVLVCTSGTVTLETAFVGTPTVICYKANPISYAIGKRLIRVSHIGLPNIILDNDVLPELVQHEANPAKINEKIRLLQTGSPRRDVILFELRKLKAMLGEKKPSKEIPKLIDYLLETYG